MERAAFGSPVFVWTHLSFVIPGEGPLGPKTRNPSAHESATRRAARSSQPVVDSIFRRRAADRFRLRHRWVPGLRCAAPGMTKGKDAARSKKDPPDTRSSGSLRRSSRGRWRVARGDGVAVKGPPGCGRANPAGPPRPPASCPGVSLRDPGLRPARACPAVRRRSCWSRPARPFRSRRRCRGSASGIRAHSRGPGRSGSNRS